MVVSSVGFHSALIRKPCRSSVFTSCATALTGASWMLLRTRMAEPGARGVVGISSTTIRSIQPERSLSVPTMRSANLSVTGMFSAAFSPAFGRLPPAVPLLVASMEPL